MTQQVKMPEPTGWITRTKTVGPEYGKEHFARLPVQSLNPLTYEHIPLITTTQAEAYKDACVREVVESVLNLLHDSRVHVEGFVFDSIQALLPPTE